jgi:DNA transformation protein
MASDLDTLKNLGNTTVNWLRAVGITSRDELLSVGPVAAYNRIRSRGIRASRALLYALHAALLDVNWKDLDPALKQRLVDEAERDHA